MCGERWESRTSGSATIIDMKQRFSRITRVISIRSQSINITFIGVILVVQRHSISCSCFANEKTLQSHGCTSLTVEIGNLILFSADQIVITLYGPVLSSHVGPCETLVLHLDIQFQFTSFRPSSSSINAQEGQKVIWSVFNCWSNRSDQSQHRSDWLLFHPTRCLYHN